VANAGYVLRVLMLLPASLGLASAVAAQPNPARSVAVIHDCASFKSWFKGQPGFRLTALAGVTVSAGGFASPAPKSSSDNNGYGGPAPKSGSDEFAVPMAVIQHFRGDVGGGGCLGGYYDPVKRLGAIESLYDTAEEVVATVVNDPPSGLRLGNVDVVTLNGVRIGMSAAEVERIEGPARRVRDRGDLVLFYSWVRKYRPNFSTIYYSIAFLVVGDRVVAMDFFYGG
jgi:hypothetical protein